WLSDNLINNRLNFNWYPNDKWKFNLGLRNRIFTGESVKLIPEYDQLLLQSEQGWIDLSRNVINEQSVILNSSIDRIYLQYETGNFSATIGRQRINWGKSFVWNPNDLFNAYSFFDFDYPEKPGSDAIRLQYYTGMASSIELAAKISSYNVDTLNSDKEDQRMTLGALWRFNKWNYDFQLLTGIFEDNEFAIGVGWSGAIKSLDFKGEITYLYPFNNLVSVNEQLIASASLGYMFPNTLNLQFEFLYTDIASNGIQDFYQYYYMPLSVKTLSFTEYNLFGQVGYQITPLLTGNFAGMYYPKIKGYYIGPSFDYSFTDNLFSSIVIQTFSGETPDPVTGELVRNDATFAYLRLKWSF
ncbi:MAG: hypothetical protein ABFS35_18775, partial [Bacteroidota bacterium]